MAFASGNTGKVEFARNADDDADGLDLTLIANNVVFWRFTEKRVSFKDVTPYAKVRIEPETAHRDGWRAPGRREWECLVRFLVRTTVTLGDLNNLPARFRVWRTTDAGLTTNYKEGRGFVESITDSGDRRGVVVAEVVIKSSDGGLTKVP